MPFGAWETGVCRTTSAGLRVIAGAACDISAYFTHRVRCSRFESGAVSFRCPGANPFEPLADAPWTRPHPEVECVELKCSKIMTCLRPSIPFRHSFAGFRGLITTRIHCSSWKLETGPVRDRQSAFRLDDLQFPKSAGQFSPESRGAWLRLKRGRRSLQTGYPISRSNIRFRNDRCCAYAEPGSSSL